ncbi:unnamed protein product [Allacma fusca]|nr:unnamed protein product [Allacma fusca]
MIKEFQLLKKLHILRSVAFYRHSHVLKETRGMQMLVQAKLKFHTLFIGKKCQDQMDLQFIQKNKKAFGALLELGKDTIEHFVIRPLKPKALIVFPNEMPAVKHITLWVISDGGYQYFEHGKDLSKTFPNVDTISFHNLTALTWPVSENWWLPGGIFSSDNFRHKIKFLKSDEILDRMVAWKLRNKFRSVKEIEFETADCYRDDYFADGILFSLKVL